MNEKEALELLRSVLGSIAPEGDIDAIGSDETIQEALGMDSIDFLNLVNGLHQGSGIDIDERDYPRLTTVAGCVRYLTTKPSGDPRPAWASP